MGVVSVIILVLDIAILIMQIAILILTVKINKEDAAIERKIKELGARIDELNKQMNEPITYPTITPIPYNPSTTNPYPHPLWDTTPMCDAEKEMRTLGYFTDKVDDVTSADVSYCYSSKEGD